MKSINVLTPNYPAEDFIERGAFVESLVKQWINLGVEVKVVAPESIWTVLKKKKNKEARKVKHIISGEIIKRPKYFTFSNKKILNFSTDFISNTNFARACLNELKLRSSDIYYGKFLKNGGLAAVSAKNKFGGWAFADLGESKLLDLMTMAEKESSKKIIQNLDGIVCVSERLKQEILQLDPKFSNIIVIPNDVDLDLFCPRDKQECRKKLNLDIDKFFVIFVGHFNERKGPKRLLKSLEPLGENVSGIFLGRGEQRPIGQRVSFCGSVPNQELPIWLGAADLMVLPTLAEGHCNAINEAIACSLPVLTSSTDDMKLREDAHLLQLVDPLDIQGLSDAIRSLYEEPAKLEEMRAKLLSWRVGLQGQKRRGELIIEWIKESLL